MMHAQAVDAEFGEVRGDLVRLLVRGEVTAEAGVDTPDLQATGVGEEVAVLNAHKPIRPGRPCGEVRKISRGRGGVIPGDHEGKAIRPGTGVWTEQAGNQRNGTAPVAILAAQTRHCFHAAQF